MFKKNARVAILISDKAAFRIRRVISGFQRLKRREGGMDAWGAGEFFGSRRQRLFCMIVQ